MNKLQLNYGLKKHWKELVAFLTAIANAFGSLYFSAQPGRVFITTVLITIGSSFLTLYYLFQEKVFYFIALNNYKDKEDWFGSGKFEFNKTNNAYLVADSEVGFIFSKCLLWSDYIFQGEFKILNECLGIIIRATNSFNYVMLQIRKDCIRPHIRINGGWICYEIDTTGLKFENNILDGEWCKFDLEVKGDSVEIKIRNKEKVIIDKIWKINKGKATTRVYPLDDADRKKPTHVVDSLVSYDYGSVGFRNDNNERALVKNLLVKSTNNP